MTRKTAFSNEDHTMDYLPPALHWHLRDHISVFGLSLAILGLISSQGRMHESRVAADSIRQQRNELRYTEQLAKTSETTAQARYQSGCLPITKVGENQLINLAEGMIVMDHHTQAAIPPGTVVCDGNGNTAIVGAGGIVGALAWTGNKEIIEDSIKSWISSREYSPAIEIKGVKNDGIY